MPNGVHRLRTTPLCSALLPNYSTCNSVRTPRFCARLCERDLVPHDALLIVFFGEWVKQIPMAALVAVMIMVSIGTFDWGSLKALYVQPKSSSVVMLATVVVTVWTHDLSKGVLVGVLLSALFFAHKVVDLLSVYNYLSEDGLTRFYKVRGQLFFASARQFEDSIDLNEPVKQVSIDLSDVHVWDITAVESLEKIHTKLSNKKIQVNLYGLNKDSRRLILRLASEPKKLLATT